MTNPEHSKILPLFAPSGKEPYRTVERHDVRPHDPIRRAAIQVFVAETDFFPRSHGAP